MQATTCFHDGIPHPILQEADGVLHNPVAFHPTHGVFNAESDRGNTTIDRFLRGGEFSSARFFLRLEDHDPLQKESLDALLLLQTTASWQGITGQLRHALLRRFALIRVT